MEKIANKLRIGEKIGFGFGLVGLLFLIVIWQYHINFSQSLNDYQHLQTVFEAQEDQAMLIEVALLNARQAEKKFLINHDIQSANNVAQHIQNALNISQQMENNTEIQFTTHFEEPLNKYLNNFQLVEAAWLKKGLDENSGLQGSFRNAVHALEEMATQLKTDDLYLNLLQIRRAEKDLGLRREEQYKTKALNLVEEFIHRINQSTLQAGLKESLIAETKIYQDALIAYSSSALSNQDINGGKGLFRQSAHRLEALISQHYIPDLERNILQLRRREKDYLLRIEPQYVQMAIQEINQIQTQMHSSQISSENKTKFKILLENYQRDFLALVEQNKYIKQVEVDMESAASQVSKLVKDRVEAIDETIKTMTTEINNSTAERTTIMLWVVIIASLLGVFLAIYITLNIVKPLRKMAELLEKLTYTELIEKMPYQENGRDEINAMAGSLNILADHRKRFIKWWQNSMNETEACEQLEGMLNKLSSEDVTELQKLKAELKEALSVKKSLLSKEYQEIRKCNEQILEQSARINHVSVSRGVVEEGANAIRYSAELIHKTLDMLSYNRH